MKMNKIRELEAVLGAGARNNKYRVIFPYMGREIDIQVHDINSPGRSIGIAEVFIKGRKYQLAGDRSDEGSFSMTFYNDPEMLIRRFFLQIIGGIENYEVPMSMGGSGLSGTGGVTAGNLSGAARRSMVAFDEIRTNFHNIQSVFHYINQQQNTRLTLDLGAHYSHAGAGEYIMAPWYQTDVRIQQLDHNEMVSADSIFHNAFPVDVGAIEYQDETGDINTTSVTFAYTSVSYGVDSVNKLGLPKT